MFTPGDYTKFIHKDFDRFFVGFDPIVKKFAEVAETATKLATNYPPYNIKKIDDNKYIIEMAVAGFGKHDIELELEDDILTIKGNTKTDTETLENPLAQMIYQGLAMRPFTRQFNLADNVEIRGARLINGILRIGLESVIPEHKKPTKIDINDTEESEKEFLTEKKGK